MYLKTKTGRKVLIPSKEENAAINAGIKSDPDTKELSAAEFKALTPVRGRPIGSGKKSQVTLRIDTEVLDSYKATGSGWQTRINAILRASMKKTAKAA